MSENKKDFEYDGHVYARTRIMDFAEFQKAAEESNGKAEMATEKEPIFGMKKFKGTHQFATNSKGFFDAIGVKVEDDTKEEEKIAADDDVTPPKEEVKVPDTDPLETV